MPILTPARWKGKKRAVEIDNRDEGTGGTSGIVLSLDQVGTGVYDCIYTLPVKVGATGQQFSLQVDTGSSDLWIASTSCSTSSCSQTHGHLYNPSGATTSGATFTIPYLLGSASGPIVWDSVSIGGYTIDHQALAAVNNVQTEPLGPDFSGILGLALPLNSVIAADVPPVIGNSSGGATWTSNLFSIDTAPSSHFLSLALSRPGSDQVQAVLGIGRHPTALVSNPSLIRYSTVISDSFGDLFWKASVRSITVYVKGVAKQVQLSTSNSGITFPNAILDSGTSLILTTTPIANAIYGPIGIKQAADGMYYVPCTTPLNMTITLDDRPEMPIHPLDLTAEPPQGNQAQLCTGLIQTADAQLTASAFEVDMVLGVPFMRNVYTVMAYSAPNSNGSFTPVYNSDQTDANLLQTITPMLGLLSLTNPTTALQEFNNVRVLNKPMDSTSTTNGSNSTSTVNVAGEKLSVGIVVLIALLSFLGLCGLLFSIRWFLLRRKHRTASTRQSEGDDNGMDKVAYMLTRTSPSKREKAAGCDGHEGMSEDELRQIRFNAHMRKERKMLTLSTMGSDRTRVGYHDGGIYGRMFGDPKGQEFGMLNAARGGVPANEDVWDPATALDWGDNTPTLAQHPPYEILPEPGYTQELADHHRRNSSLALLPLLPSQSQREDD